MFIKEITILPNAYVSNHASWLDEVAKNIYESLFADIHE